MRVVVLAMMVAAIPCRARAQDEKPQPLQELFLTEVVYPQEKGETQLTFGSLVDRSHANHAAVFEGSVEYGLTSRWQIEASWSGYTAAPRSILDDLGSSRGSIGTKYSFMNIAHSPLHLAFGFDAEFPDRGSDDNDANLELEPSVALAFDVGRHVGFFASVRGSFSPKEADLLIDEGDKPDDPGTMSAGGLVAFHRVTMAVEYINRSDNLPWRMNGSPMVTPSVILHPGGQWELGFGFPFGTRDGAHRPGLGFHVIKEFQ